MKINFIKTKEILELEKEISYELEVNERPIDSGGPQFYVCFPNGDIMYDGGLIGKYGNGNTVDEALSDYCKRISGRRIVFDAYTPERKEIQLPRLKHTKFIGY